MMNYNQSCNVDKYSLDVLYSSGPTVEEVKCSAVSSNELTVSWMAEFSSSVADCSDSMGIVRYQLDVQEYQEGDSLEQVTRFPNIDPSIGMFNVDNLSKHYIINTVCVCVCVQKGCN